MKIEEFVQKSEGVWKSMRSSHSLSFQQFEQIKSLIKIERVSINSREIKSLIIKSSVTSDNLCCPFKIAWSSESDWEENESTSGECFCLPINQEKNKGQIVRSTGYAENIPCLSDYEFLTDNTFILKTIYDQSIVEERIWFISNNLRCRSSTISTSKGTGILQISFASELRQTS